MFVFICILVWMAISGCLAGTILAYGKAKERWYMDGDKVILACLCSLFWPLTGPAFAVYYMLGKGDGK